MNDHLESEAKPGVVSRLGFLLDWRYAGRHGWWLGLLLMLETAVLLSAIKIDGSEDIIEFLFIEDAPGHVLGHIVKPVMLVLFLLIVLPAIAAASVFYIFGEVVFGWVLGVLLSITLIAADIINFIDRKTIPSVVLFVDLAFVIAYFAYRLDQFLGVKLLGSKFLDENKRRIAYHLSFLTIAGVASASLVMTDAEKNGWLVTDTISRLLYNPVRWARVNEIKEGTIRLSHYDCYSTAPVSRWLSTSESVEISMVGPQRVELRFVQQLTGESQCYYLKLPERVPGLVKLNPLYEEYKRRYARDDYAPGYSEHVMEAQRYCFADPELQRRLPELLRTATWENGWIDYQFLGYCRAIDSPFNG